MRKPGSTVLVALAAAFSIYSTAQPLMSTTSKLTPTEHEQKMVSSINSAYYDAFNLPREKNWVLQKIEAGTMQPGCWPDQDTFYAVGAEQIFDGLTMECVQIGKSTRVFWPSRWVAFCKKNQLSLGRCMVERFNPA